MTRPEEQHQNNRVQEAWNHAAARPHPAGSFQALVKDADPESCVGVMEQLLRLDGSESLCQHIWHANGKLAWWVLLEKPGQVMCGDCVPAEYSQLLTKRWRRVRMRCSCCQAVRWLAGPILMQNTTGGTALGFLCGPCSTQRPGGGMVEVSW